MKVKSNFLTNEYLDTYLNLHKIKCSIISPDIVNVYFVDGIDEQKCVSFSTPNQDCNASDINFFVQKRLNILGKPVFEVIQNVRCKEILYLLSNRLAENTYFFELLKRDDLKSLSNNKAALHQKLTLIQVLNSELKEFVTNEVVMLQNFDICKERNNPLNKDFNLK